MAPHLHLPSKRTRKNSLNYQGRNPEKGRRKRDPSSHRGVRSPMGAEMDNRNGSKTSNRVEAKLNYWKVGTQMIILDTPAPTPNRITFP
jgi:hypothetical protein